MYRKIYHYCSLRTAIEYILPQQQLLLNRAGNSNDPRENKSFNFAYWNNPPLDLDLHKLNDIISQEIRKDVKFTCFSSDDNKIRGYGYSRLWALYGENHKGVCLEIDEDQFLIENADVLRNGYYEDVEYDDVQEGLVSLNVDYERLDKIGVPKYVLEEFRSKNLKYFFFRKNNEWASENETRLIYFSKETTLEYCSIRKSLSRIILGVDFIDHYIPAIQKLSDVEIKKISYWSGKFGLEDIDKVYQVQ